jgi:hypothetical protein
MKTEFEKQCVENLTNELFIESRNPLVRFGLRFLGHSVTKKEFIEKELRL